MRFAFLSLAFGVGCAVSSVGLADEFHFKAPDGSGDFETVGNWWVNDLPATALPGEGDQICCTNGPQTIRFAEAGASRLVGRVSLDRYLYDSQNKIQRCRDQQLSLDLNGGTLCVTGVVAMRASRYEGVVCPSFTVTNGTLFADGIKCAGADSNYRGRFAALGAGTRVVCSNETFLVEGAESKAVIGGGASLVWHGKGYPSVSSAQGYPTAELVVEGAGTTLSGTNGFYLGGFCRWIVRDQARVSFAGYCTPGRYGRQDRSSIGSGNGARLRSDAELLIDDAAFSVTNGKSIMVANADRYSLSGHRLTIQNNGSLNFSGETSLHLAYVQSAPGVATSNVISVCSGGRLAADGNTVPSEWSTVGAITVGGGEGDCCENGVYVSNGVVSVNHLTLGGSKSSSNNWLRVEGRTSRVLLNQKFAAPGNLPNNRGNPALGLYNDARLELTLGPDGFDNPPIEMTTELGRIYGQQMEGSDQKARLVVRDCGFAQKHPDETVVLIKTLNAANRGYFETLIADATILAARNHYCGTLSVSADGMSLCYTAPSRRGGVIRVR